MKTARASGIASIAAAATLAGLSGMAVAAGPEDSAEAGERGRYALERSGDGFVRLDTKTGEMSLCRVDDDRMVCRMAADERRAFDEAFDALAARVTALEKAAGTPGAAAGDALPSDDELDRAMGMMEKVMRRFFGMVEGFRNEFGHGSGSEPDAEREAMPNRT